MSQLPSIRLRPSETEFLETQSFNEGSVFYDKNKNTLVLMNGRQQGGFELLRADLSNATTGLGVEVSPTPPTNARPGSLWLSTQSGELFIYLNDGDSEQWVQPSSPIFSINSSNNSSYTLPTATTSVLGGVRIDGTTITINNGVISAVISGNSGVSSNGFSTVSVSGQANIIATSNTDTLTLAAGPNITLSTNSANKTVTISSTGTSSGIALTSLSVAVNSASGSGNLTYNNNTGQFTFTPPNFPATLAALSDVAVVSPSNGQVLKYNSSTARWVNSSDLTGDGGTGIGLSDLSVTTATALGNGALSYSNTTGIFTFTPPNLAGFITLSSISASGDITYNNSSGVISFNNSTGYITRTGISVTQATASGNGSLVYSNSTGVFTFTPPDLSSVVGGTASDSFTTIAVLGQSNIVADSSSDTLTIVAGTGIAITTDATTDTVTIASTVSSGATAFTGLSDRADLTVDRFYLPAITMLTATNNGASSYRFDQYGTADNPTVYAISGTTIAFNLNIIGHPFLIQTSGGSNYDVGLTHVTTGGVVTTGSAAQGKTSGTLYWKIPVATTGNYRYICSIHGVMVGVIAIKDLVTI
jgi:plastocyanin